MDMGMLSSAPNHNRVTEGIACGGSMAGDAPTLSERVRPRAISLSTATATSASQLRQYREPIDLPARSVRYETEGLPSQYRRLARQARTEACGGGRVGPCGWLARGRTMAYGFAGRIL
jgi:hypothetical protein